MLPPTTDVLIVGAGPTGLALAATLQQAGIDYTLIEKRLDIENTSRAAVVHAHTLDVLDRIGAAEPLMRNGLVLRRFTLRDRNHALVNLDFSQAPSPHPCILMIPQHETERLLGERLAKAGGSIHRGATLRELAVDVEGVTAHIETQEGLKMLRARYVVGADGMHSLVRETAGIGFTGSTLGESLVLADVHLDWKHGSDEVMLCFSPQGMAVVAPLPGDTFRIVATYDDPPEKPSARLIEGILKSRGPAGDLRVTDAGWSSRFRVHHRLADRYRNGPLFLMGDAAHVHSPAGGQGMNTGLVDAVVLGEAFIRVLKNGKPESYLDNYERLRRPAAAEVLKIAGRLTRLATMHGAFQRWLRNVIISTIFKRASARRKLMMGLSGLDRADAAKLPD